MSSRQPGCWNWATLALAVFIRLGTQHCQDRNTRLNEAQLATTTNPINGITTNTVANAASVCLTWLFAAGVGNVGTPGDSKYNSFQERYVSSSPMGSNCRRRTRTARASHHKLPFV